MGCLLIKEAMFANCILFETFCSMGTLVRRRKTWRYSARKVMEFGLLMADGGSDVVSVSCFGVRVSVMFHYMFVHYTFSSVWVAEWPPFGK